MGSDAELSLRVLGPVEVAVGGRPLRIGSAHQRLLLAVLLVAPGEAVSGDRLVDDLWGDRAPAGARRSLHSHVSRLRRALADASDDGAR